MEGKFIRKKFDFWHWVLLVSGLLSIGMYFFLIMVDPEAEATGDVLFFLIAGIVICLSVILTRLLNIGAFIHVDEDSIKGKYNWFGRIDCRPSDVAFATASYNTLTIQLKNGKTHNVTSLENSHRIASMLRKNMNFEVAERPEALIEKLNGLQSSKKKYALYLLCGIALTFIWIIVTLFLIGEKELNEFNRTDRTVLAVMGATEIATLAADFIFARKAANNIPIERLRYEIRRKIIETEPLLPGNIIKVFADEYYTGRITLFGFPNNCSVYFKLQEFAPDHTLSIEYESEIYENAEQLPGGFERFIDITADIKAR